MIETFTRKYCALFALLLLSIIALPFESAADNMGISGPNTSRGNLLRKPEYQTYNSLAFFADSATGNDNSSCTSAAAPCATVQGVINKIPKLIHHPVTIDLAAGNYAGFMINSFTFDPASVTNGAYIWIRSTLKTWTGIATGTATGTATAGSAGSNATFGTLTDGANTWTVDNLRGYILETTGGTGSGQFKVIESNTATAITIVGTFSPAPDVTTTYAIRDWDAVVNTAQNQSAQPNVAAANSTSVQLLNNNSYLRVSTTSAPIYFDKIKIVAPASSNALFGIGGNQIVFFSQCRMEASTAGFSAMSASSGLSTRWNTSYAISAANTINLGGSNTSSNNNATHFTTGTMFVSTGSGVSAMTLTGGGFTSTVSEFRTTHASSAQTVLVSAQLGGAQINTTRFECAAGSSTSGLKFAESFSVNGYAQIGGSISAFNNCATGISIQGTLRVIMSGAWPFTNLTNGILVSKGANVVLSSTATFTTVTNEVSIDGTVYTAAAINALVPPIVTNLNYGTWVGQ